MLESVSEAVSANLMIIKSSGVCSDMKYHFCVLGSLGGIEITITVNLVGNAYSPREYLQPSVILDQKLPILIHVAQRPIVLRLQLVILLNTPPVTDSQEISFDGLDGPPDTVSGVPGDFDVSTSGQGVFGI
jgi:hypothetical protein